MKESKVESRKSKALQNRICAAGLAVCLFWSTPVWADDPAPREGETIHIDVTEKEPQKKEPERDQWGFFKAPNLVDKVTGTPAREDIAEKKKRDPFSATSRLVRQKNETEAVQAGSHAGFLPGAQPPEMPKLRLRGHLQDKNNQVVALLEIQGGGVYIVREGDTVGLHDFGYDSVIRIQKISRLHLVVESGTLGRLIIVR